MRTHGNPQVDSTHRTPHNSIPNPYTYIGDGEMSEYNDTRRCSLCGVTIHNFRVIKPILRYDPSRPYFHRFGRDRGIKTTTPVGWSCGKHHVIDPDWLPHETRNEVAPSPIDRRNVLYDNACMPTAAVELREIRDQLGLSREKLARQLGVTQDTVYKWEKGARPVKETALFLARRLLMESRETGA